MTDSHIKHLFAEASAPPANVLAYVKTQFKKAGGYTDTNSHSALEILRGITGKSSADLSEYPEDLGFEMMKTISGWDVFVHPKGAWIVYNGGRASEIGYLFD